MAFSPKPPVKEIKINPGAYPNHGILLGLCFPFQVFSSVRVTELIRKNCLICVADIEKKNRIVYEKIKRRKLFGATASSRIKWKIISLFVVITELSDDMREM